MRVVIDDEDERFPKIVWQEYVSGNKYKGDIIWDGKFKDGKRAPQGTYYITIKAADMAGNESRRTGSVTIGRLGFLQSIPAFMPPTSVMDPDANPPTPSASTTSTTFGGTITSSMGAVNQSVLLSTGAASSSTLPPSNILWGVAAAALAGWATSTALEERQRRKEEEEQQRRQAEAQASRLNAAESMRKAQEWQAGQNILEQQEAGLAAYYSARKLGEAESAQKAELAEQQAGLKAYYEGRKAGEAQQAKQTVAAKVLAMPVKEDDPPKWWEKAVDWVDDHQVITSIGIGLAVGLGAAAIIATGGLATPLVVIAGAALVAGGLTAGGTMALNTYKDRPLTQNLVSNVGTAATAAVVIALAPVVIPAGQAVVGSVATTASMYAYALGASWVGSATSFAAPAVGVGWSLWALGSLGAIGYGASVSSDPTLPQDQREDGAIVGALGLQSLDAAVNVYETANLINSLSAFNNIDYDYFKVKEDARMAAANSPAIDPADFQGKTAAEVDNIILDSQQDVAIGENYTHTDPKWTWKNPETGLVEESRYHLHGNPVFSDGPSGYGPTIRYGVQVVEPVPGNEMPSLSAVKAADNELTSILGQPTWRPVTVNADGVNVDLYYVDKFGFGYWGTDGQIGGLATNTGHIPGAGNPWPNIP